ncbi:DUF6119 family protein [Candidatus Phytoplasma solani]
MDKKSKEKKYSFNVFLIKPEEDKKDKKQYLKKEVQDQYNCATDKTSSKNIFIFFKKRDCKKKSFTKWYDYFVTTKKQREENNKKECKCCLIYESAIVFVEGKINKKKFLFAITFGRGFNDLKKDILTKNFGIEMVKKIVDPNKIKEVNYFSFKNTEGVFEKKQQFSKLIQVNEFVSYEENSRSGLKEIKGEIQEEEPYKLEGLVSGKDSFKFNSDKKLDQLVPLIKYIWQIHLKRKEKEEFKKICGISEVKKDKIDFYDNKLIKMLIKKIKEYNNKSGSEESNNEIDELAIVIPDFIEYNDEYAIELRYNKNKIVEEVNLDNLDKILSTFFSHFKEEIKEKYKLIEMLIQKFEEKGGDSNLKDNILDFLKKKYKLVIKKETNVENDYTFYKCLNFCFVNEGKIISLYEGKWYLHSNSLEQIDKQIKNHFLDANATDEKNKKYLLPSFQTFKNEKKAVREEDYNKWVVDKKGENYFLFDRKCIKFKDEDKSTFELCDILQYYSENENLDEIILHHVKKFHGSSSLSHLFNQGQIFINILCDRYEDYKENIKSKILKICEENIGQQIIECINKNERIKIKTVYQIIKTKTELPIFSKIILNDVLKKMNHLGFEFFYTFI